MATPENNNMSFAIAGSSLVMMQSKLFKKYIIFKFAFIFTKNWPTKGPMNRLRQGPLDRWSKGPQL